MKYTQYIQPVYVTQSGSLRLAPIIPIATPGAKHVSIVWRVSVSQRVRGRFHCITELVYSLLLLYNTRAVMFSLKALYQYMVDRK